MKENIPKNIEKLIKRNTTHELSKKSKRLYSIWKSMRSRCNTPSSSAYHNYGARGIKVCIEWDDYSIFYKWSIDNGYDDSVTLDRVDVNGNYEPSNCRWISRLSQNNNKRNNVKTFVNDELLTLAEISRKYEINYGTLLSRYKKGIRGLELIKKVNLINCVINGEKISIVDAFKKYNVSYDRLLYHYHKGNNLDDYVNGNIN